jgi:hypothetical protein
MYEDCNLLMAMHWKHRFNYTVKRYNEIYRVQMPDITPHVCAISTIAKWKVGHESKDASDGGIAILG